MKQNRKKKRAHTHTNAMKIVCIKTRQLNIRKRKTEIYLLFWYAVSSTEKLIKIISNIKTN